MPPQVRGRRSPVSPGNLQSPRGSLDPVSPLAAARQLGAHEGETFDRRLRDGERAEREERLSRLAWGFENEKADACDPGRGQTPLEVMRLEREVERLAAYFNAVQGSRAWRLTQRLRRVVGRAW